MRLVDHEIIHRERSGLFQVVNKKEFQVLLNLDIHEPKIPYVQLTQSYIVL